MNRSEEILQSLKNSKAQGRLHHAYIFSGAPGVGKTETIKKFAASVFSEGANLLERIERSGHPDLVWIRRNEDGPIAVEQVRELHRTLSFSPLESKYRFVVIEEAQHMNATTMNAILKILEEPPSHTIFFLTCPDGDLLLQTIRSRCQLIRFFPLPKEVLLEKLTKEFPEEEKRKLEYAVDGAEGSFFRAKEYLENEEKRDLHMEAKNILLQSWETSPRIPSSSLKFLESINDEEKLDTLLLSWESLLRDAVILLSCEKTEIRLYNEDLRKRIQEFFSSRMDASAEKKIILQEFVEKHSAIHRARVQQDYNVNRKLTLENLLCELQVFSIGKRH